MVEVARMCACWICARGVWRRKVIQVHLREEGQIVQREIQVCTRCYVLVSQWVREHPGQPYAATEAVSERLGALAGPLRLKEER